MREAQAAARLHHTNIIPVFDSGNHGGTLYYVMQYIEGDGLDRVLRYPCDSPAAAGLFQQWKRIAEIGRQCAAALQYAHVQGVLHRDIKPANLVFDRRGTAWIADFGLAKVAEHHDITAPGDAVGTLRYMPPEQLDGATDQRSDVYSLGLSLYELITWRPAFAERERMQLIRRISGGAVVPPRQIDRTIPKDLETIVLKAVAREPANRYASAAELGGDLARFLNDRPVRARRMTSAEQLWRWSARNPALATLSCATAALLLLVATVAGIGYFHSSGALARESEQRQSAVAAHLQADQERGRAEGNLRLALAAFDEICLQLAGRPDIIGNLRRRLKMPSLSKLPSSPTTPAPC